MRSSTNLFAEVDHELAGELIQTLVANQLVRIERIVSTGQNSPVDFWYDQDESEWVAVLRGEAKLLFADDLQPVHLRPGDHVNIPAHTRHRVDWTTTEEPTVWLAVFYRDE